METRPNPERWGRQRTRETFVRLAAAREAGTWPQQDLRLRDELIVAHLNLVRFLAAKFAHRGEPIDDLIQVGTIGLLKAVDRFDPARGVEFSTYATPTIVGEIKRYFRDKGWAVRVPRRIQELNLAINRQVEKLQMDLGRFPTLTELAATLGASEEDILEAQELGQSYNHLSLDSDLTDEPERRQQSLVDSLGVEDSELALLEDRTNLERAFTVLAPRERVILYLRFYENLSQAEIAKRLHVSQMHISRLQHRALGKLKSFFQR